MATEIVGIETKVCKKCGKEKAVEDFKLISEGKYQYRQGRCLECQREVQRESLQRYRKHSGHKIQARHRERLKTDPEYTERKRQQYRDKYKRNREWKLNYQRNYRANRPEQVRATDKNKRLKKEYGITLKQFGEMVASQGFKCPICKGELAADSKAHVDHCHVSGAVRGVLCGLCNVGLGSFRDSPEALLAAVEYLKSPPAINNTRAKEIKNGTGS